MKVAAWNVNSIRSRLEHASRWIFNNNPDILLLQEIKCKNENFPREAPAFDSYNIETHGNGGRAGVAILSKYPLEDIKTTFPGDPDIGQARFLEAICNTEVGLVRIISLYAPNGGEVGSDKFEYKLQYFDALTVYISELQRFDEHLIIGGDINIAASELDVYNHKALENSTCYTLEERKKLWALQNQGLTDSFRLLHPRASEFSWWDYRAGSWQHNKGMRIDYIYCSNHSANLIKNAYIDSTERSYEKASDHAPVIAEFKL